MRDVWRHQGPYQQTPFQRLILFYFYCRVLKGGVFKGGGNWGTLRIPREDWGTLGKTREPPPLGTPLNNPIILRYVKSVIFVPC